MQNDIQFDAPFMGAFNGIKRHMNKACVIENEVTETDKKKASVNEKKIRKKMTF